MKCSFCMYTLYRNWKRCHSLTRVVGSSLLKQGAASHIANLPMIYSVLCHTCSEINTSYVLSNLYSLIYRKSSAILIGSPINASVSVAISYLNSKSLNVASFYEEVPTITHDQAEAERTDFDPSLTSIHNSDVEINNSGRCSLLLNRPLTMYLCVLSRQITLTQTSARWMEPTGYKCAAYDVSRGRTERKRVAQCHWPRWIQILFSSRATKDSE